MELSRRILRNIYASRAFMYVDAAPVRCIDVPRSGNTEGAAGNREPDNLPFISRYAEGFTLSKGTYENETPVQFDGFDRRHRRLGHCQRFVPHAGRACRYRIFA